MKVSYDLHIHSCLSPCADIEMTPNNIVNMSVLNGLNVIAITDHNSCKNCKALVEAGTKVKAGTPIIKIDREFILGKGLSLATPVLITNVDAAKSINAVESGSVTAGKDVVLNFEI